MCSLEIWHGLLETVSQGFTCLIICSLHSRRIKGGVGEEKAGEFGKKKTHPFPFIRLLPRLNY